MLENAKVGIRIKLSLLWIALMFFYIYNDYFELYIPEKIEQIMNGTSALNSPFSILMASVVMSIPTLMILFSIFLQPSICRWMNVIFGVIFTIIISAIAITSISEWYTGYIFYSFIEVLISVAIVWSAWHWPRIDRVENELS